MSEKIADIHENINQRKRIKDQIAEVYSTSNNSLSDLKTDISDTILENKLTMQHVVAVLTKAQKDLEIGKYSDVVEKMGAGLTLSIQIALKQLSNIDGNQKFDPGVIDGVYMKLDDKNSKDKTKYANSNTRKAVKAFQEANGLTGNAADGRAGKDTIAKILEKLDTTNNTKGNTNTESITDNNIEQTNIQHLEEIKRKYNLPKIDGNWEIEEIEPKDYVSAIQNTIILKGVYQGQKIEISFAPIEKIASPFLKIIDYQNPKLISGNDSFDLLTTHLYNEDKQTIHLYSKTNSSNDNNVEQISPTVKIENGKKIDDNSAIPSRVNESTFGKYLNNTNTVDKNIDNKKVVSDGKAEILDPLAELKKNSENLVIPTVKLTEKVTVNYDVVKKPITSKTEKEVVTVVDEVKEKPEIRPNDKTEKKAFTAEETESLRKLQEGIEEGKAILDKLTNLGLPDGWTWKNNDKKVLMDAKTYGFSIEILSNENTPAKYKIEFDKNGNFIDNNTTGIYNGKAFKFDVEDGKIILKKISDSYKPLSQEVNNKINIFPEQIKGRVINKLQRIQDEGYKITINEEPGITTSSNGNITEYAIKGNFSLSDDNGGIKDNPINRRNLEDPTYSGFESSNIQSNGEKITSFDFIISEII